MCFRAPLGGLFRHVNDLAREFSELGHQVGMVFDSSEMTGALTRRVKDIESMCSLGVLRIPMPKYPSIMDIGVVRKLRAFCRTSRAEVLHGHGAKGGLYARLAGKQLGIPVVYTPHGGSLHYSKDNLTGRLLLGVERFLLKRTDGIIFESNFAATEYRNKIGQPECKSKIIYNGLTDAEFTSTAIVPDHDFVFVGELRHLKGVDVLLKAVAVLRERGYQPSVGIFGEGPDAQGLREEISRLHIGELVTMHGPAANGREALSRGQCAVVPSRRESLPYIVLEALAMRKPLIATKVGGIPEIVGDRVVSELIAPDDPSALAEKMTGFLNDRGKVICNCTEAYRRVNECFRLKAMVNETLDIYQAVKA